ncbi:unnamed protein product, partial [Oppiella nova]
VKPVDLLLRCATLLREVPGQDLNISKVISHEDYNKNVSINCDIGLLQVTGEFKLGTSALDKIKLPDQDQDYAAPGSVATVTGWGVNADYKLPEKLQTVDVPVLDRATCISDYKSSISDYMFCAGYDEGKRDHCYADSGGPLKFNNTLIGIVSWALGCAEPHHPGVYTRLVFTKHL